MMVRREKEKVRKKRRRKHRTRRETEKTREMKIMRRMPPRKSTSLSQKMTTI